MSWVARLVRRRFAPAGLVAGLVVALLLGAVPLAGPGGSSGMAGLVGVAAATTDGSERPVAGAPSAETGSPSAASGTGWTAIDLGDRDGGVHGCGVRVDRSLWCWGPSTSGQVGDGSGLQALAPVRVGATTGWAGLALGRSSSCALKQSGALWCWGSNAQWQLAAGRKFVTVFEPRRVLRDTPLAEVVMGGETACGLTEVGALWCWGSNVRGKVGADKGAKRLRPVEVGPGTSWSAVSLSPEPAGHACAVAADGGLWCWGDNSLGQLGLGQIGGQHRAPTQVGSETTWATVAAGTVSTCATQVDGSLWCWGDGRGGAVGTGDDEVYPVPVRVGVDRGWRSVSAGAAGACAIDTGGAAWCWGANDEGQVGDGTTRRRFVPTAVVGGATWTSLRLGFASVCGLTPDGAARCWGDGGDAQLGRGDYQGSRTPADVLDEYRPRAVTWATLDSGSRATCGITAVTRTVACWSATGVSSVEPGPYASPVSRTATGWTAVSAGGGHACAIAADGGLWCAGSNADGELGDGSAQDADTFVRVGTAPWAAVDLGASSTCAVQQADGGLWCWGSGASGVLGLGDLVSRATPTRVGTESWVDVAMHAEHACGVRADASLWCWGANDQGQLGIGSRVDRLVPTRVGSSQHWSDVAVGEQHSCATTTAGAVWCWGDNQAGQVGDGTTTDRLVPTSVPGAGTGWTELELTASSCAFALGAGATCWGDGVLTPSAVEGTADLVVFQTRTDSQCGVGADGSARCRGAAPGDGSQRSDSWVEVLAVKGLKS